MKVFKHRHFQQWVKSEKVKDDALIKAVDEITKGLHDGDLGAGLYKKRLAMPGQGKRGSYRTLLAYHIDKKAIFLYGFSKNERGNIDQNEKAIYRKLAKILLNASEETLTNMIKAGSLIEVN